MERAEYLLLKMLEQLRRNESKAQLLQSLKGLQQEIEQSFPTEEPVPTPVSAIPPYVPPVADIPVAEEEKVFEVLQINESEIDWEQEENGPILQTEEEEEEEAEEEEEGDPKETNLAQSLLSKFLSPPPVDALLNPEFVEEKPSPTPVLPKNAVELSTEPVNKEVNQKWTESNPELMSRFAESPIKDLKKAIGINDRYRFIHELFKGDEVMYERSIKTINDFSIYPEAEFWVRRELKTKLGWNQDEVLVQQFDQLVRRRFS